MIGSLHDTGLRQRRGAPGDNEDAAVVRQALPPAPRQVPTMTPPLHQQQQQQQQQPPPFVWKVSHVYCFISAFLAVLAIITSASPTSTLTAGRNGVIYGGNNNNGNPFETSLGEGTSSSSSASTATSSSSNAELKTSNPLPTSAFMLDVLETDWWRQAMDFLFTSGTHPPAAAPVQEEPPEPPLPWWKALFVHPSNNNNSQNNRNQNKQSSNKHNHQEANNNNNKYSSNNVDEEDPNNSTAPWWQNWLDHSLLHPQASTITDLIDKVLTSTPRLLAIANLLLALTYQMHTAVADWFLGVGAYPPPGEWAMNGRERLGSFLVFKLLLISAVVAPDTLDLTILLSWYTLLSFLRSLAHLAAATTSHTTQSGQPPRSGVLQLLLLVLLCDFVAVATCVALFMEVSGWNIVLLLTFDCALLAVEVLGHVLKHARQVLEDKHEHTIARMEEQQVQIHTRQRLFEQQQQQQQRNQEGNVATAPAFTTSEGGVGDVSLAGDDDGYVLIDEHRILEDSRQLDQAMDVLEVRHTRRLAILDGTVFGFQLVAHALTVAHFLHIWCLHGIQFTLIDGVLALHLHSAFSAAFKQIAERRNLHRIARNLDGMFPNASEMELTKSLSAGDVCCICLGAMSAGSVKKVGCGHLYHTNCLREVIERARSIEAAKCPLCRASVLDGTHPGTNTSSDAAQANVGAGEGGDLNNNVNGGTNANNAGNHGGNARGGGINHRGAGERALFRFSTEGILPAWLPLPAFSFEVVRRPTRLDPPAQPANAANGRVRNNNNNNDNNNNNNGNRNRHERSFFRRLLLLAGAIPMSPEEEARALASLVDMFPQYDRADLLRELRDRGSAESVVESVLLGVFSGRVRGSAGTDNINRNVENGNENGTEERAGGQASIQDGDVPPQQQVEPIR